MTVLSEVLALFDLKVTGTDKVKKGDDATQKFTKTLRKFASAAAVVAAGVILRRMTNEVIDLGVELDLNSRRLGVTTRQLQALGLMGADAGVGVDKVVDAMSTLQERMRDAVQDPKSDPAVQLRALGVAIPRSMAEMPDAITLLGQASDGLEGMSNQTERVGAAMTLFGDVGRELLPVLQNGREGIEAYNEQLDALGGGLSENVIEASREATRAQARLEIVTRGLESRLGLFLIPALTRAAEITAQFVTAISALADRSNVLQAVLVALGVVAAGVAIAMLIAWGPIIAAVLLAVAGFVLLTLIIDDLIALFTGGKSKIGEFIDEMFGAGAAAQVVLSLSEAWDSVADAATDAWRAVQRALGVEVAARDETARRAELAQRSSRRTRLLAQVAEGRRRTTARGQDARGTSGTVDDAVNSVPGLEQLNRGANAGFGALRRSLGIQSNRELRLAQARSGGGATVNASQHNNIHVGSNAQAEDVGRALRRGRDQQARAIRSATPRGAP